MKYRVDNTEVKLYIASKLGNLSSETIGKISNFSIKAKNHLELQELLRKEDYFPEVKSLFDCLSEEVAYQVFLNLPIVIEEMQKLNDKYREWMK